MAIIQWLIMMVGLSSGVLIKPGPCDCKAGLVFF